MNKYGFLELFSGNRIKIVQISQFVFLYVGVYQYLSLMDPVVKYYDQLAKEYDQDRFENTYGRFIDMQERRILNQLFFNSDGVIVDLACGSGRLSNFATIGVDASSAMLEIARKKNPSTSFYLADAEKLPFEDSSVDCILTFHFFMHLDEVKVSRILDECWRVLKPGGRLIFDIPSKKRRNLLRYKQEGWHGNFSLTSKEVELQFSKFEVVQSFGILSIPIHRLPHKLRFAFSWLDWRIGNSWMKEYSSYHIYEMKKK